MSNPGTISNKKPTGLFFGSFNPIHLGHLCIAEYMINYAGLKDLWFMVSPQNPLKNKQSLLSAANRLDLVNEAIKDDFRFSVNDIEFHLPLPSYTIDTLTYLGEQFPDRMFYLIAGTDVLPTLHKWKNYQLLLSNYRFLIFPRHGSDDHPLLQHPSITLVDAPRIEISATFIRKAIKEGKTVNYFLPPGVYRLIEKWGFYQ